MSAPGNDDDAPPGCPRVRDGGNGPRACGLVQCRLHLRGANTRGPAGKRLRLAMFVEDSCARDVARRAKAHGVRLTYRELAILMGSSRQAIHRTAKEAIAKVLRALGMDRDRE